jgi:hypothetical protein
MTDRLRPDERAALGTLCDCFDWRRVTLHRGGGEAGTLATALRRLVLGLSGGRAVALGNHVFLPDRARADLATLAHELTHCAQYQAWGPLRYFARGALEQGRDLAHRLTGLGTSPYRYVPDGRPFEAYGMEQQGQIVEDRFRRDPAAARASPFHAGAGRHAPRRSPHAP